MDLAASSPCRTANECPPSWLRLASERFHTRVVGRVKVSGETGTLAHGQIGDLMELLVERLTRRGLELGRWLELERGEPAEVRVVREDSRAARLPDYDDSQAPVLRPGGDWREPLKRGRPRKGRS